MNVEETKKAIEVMQAFVDGKKVISKTLDGKHLSDFHPGSPNSFPSWDWDNFTYEIKREPRRFILFLNESGQVINGSSDQDTSTCVVVKATEDI